MRRVLAVNLTLAFALALIAPASVYGVDPPPNDTFGQATLLTGLTVPGAAFPKTVDIAGATYPDQGGELDACSRQPARTVWYTFTATMSGSVTVTTAGSSVANPAVTAYMLPASTGVLRGILPCGTTRTSVTFNVLNTGVYYIQGADDGTVDGTLQLNFSFSSLVPYDAFASARGMTSVWQTDVVDISAATMQAGESLPPSCAGSDRTVWYRYNATTSGAITVDPAGSTASGSTLVAYLQTSPSLGLGGLVPISCTYGPLVFNVAAGYTYYIQASDRGPAGGYLRLTWSLGPTVDLFPPVISGTPGDITRVTTSPDGLAVAYDLPTAIDDVSGVVPVKCAPASGDLFPLGTTHVLCTAKDAAGNLATSGFNVRVERQVAVPAGIPIVGYDVTLTPQSGWWGYNHTYDGSTAYTGRLVQGGFYATPLLDYSGGGGTLNDGYSTPSADNELLSLHHDTAGQLISPSIVIHLDGLYDVSSIWLYGGEASGPGAPPAEAGAITAVTVGVGGQNVRVVTTPFGTSSYWQPGNDDRIDLAGTALAKAATDTIVLSGFEAMLEGVSDPYQEFSIAEIVVQGGPSDVTPPVLALPADLTVDATSPAGAVVTYTATAIDEVDGAVDASCEQASGGTFAIGTTSVSCSATDAAGNTATGTFDVTVRVTYSGMKTLTTELVWKAGIATQLDAYLDAAYRAEQKGNLKAEASNLESYRSLLRAQAGKAVAASDADALIALSYRL